MMEGPNCHEEIEVYGVADRVRFAAGGDGAAVAKVCRKLGISEATFYSWKKEVQRVGSGRAEAIATVGRREQRLKQIVEDLTLDKQMLQDVLKKALKEG